MNIINFSPATKVRVFKSRMLLTVSYSVILFLFGALFSEASAHLAGQRRNDNQSSQSIAERESGATGGNNSRSLGDTTLAFGQSVATVKDQAIKDAPVQSDATRPVVEKINAIRKLAGIQPVELDEALSRACRLHAQYLVTNRADPKAQGLGAHTERQELPGFTAEGNKAAGASDIFWGRDIGGAVERWMAGLYHRIPILRPNLKRIGFGYEGNTVVADVVSGVVGPNLDSVAYPADGQSDVPTEFGVEIPNPLPKDAPRKAGYPITLLFPFVTKIAVVEAALSDSAGGKVEFHLSDPENPATSFPQQNTVCLIPIKPLAPNTTYKVSIKVNADGSVVRKSWSFVTRQAQARK